MHAQTSPSNALENGLVKIYFIHLK